MELFASILIMIRANEESETKSNRLNERRGADRARARAGGYFARADAPHGLCGIALSIGTVARDGSVPFRIARPGSHGFFSVPLKACRFMRFAAS